MGLTKPILIAAAVSTLAPIQATAAFVDHQAIRACFARAQFQLTQNNGDMVISNQALKARKANKGWDVTGDIYVSEAARDGSFRLTCTASEGGVSVQLTEIQGADRLDR